MSNLTETLLSLAAVVVALILLIWHVGRGPQK